MWATGSSQCIARRAAPRLERSATVASSASLHARARSARALSAAPRTSAPSSARSASWASSTARRWRHSCRDARALSTSSRASATLARHCRSRPCLVASTSPPTSALVRDALSRHVSA